VDGEEGELPLRAVRDALEPARWWSWRRQRLDRSCRNVDDCLRSVVAVPAANPWGPLALLARIPRLTPGHAADATTSQVGFRTRAIRGTPMLVPFEAAPHALALGALVPAVARAQRNAGESKAMAKTILKLAEDAPVPRDEIPAALRRSNTNLDPLLDQMCLRGDLTEVAPGSPLEDRWSVVATDGWVDPDETIEAEQALRSFLIGYLSAFGPATAEDASGFFGISLKRIRGALAEIATADVGGGLLLLERDARGFKGIRPYANRVTLLPRGDAWLHAYEGDSLRRFGSPRAINASFDGRGLAKPSILLTGELVGTWDLNLRRKTATISIDLVQRLEERALKALDDELQLVARFIDAAGLDTEVDPLPKPKR
jgi:hypothetical protein